MSLKEQPQTRENPMLLRALYFVTLVFCAISATMIALGLGGMNAYRTDFWLHLMTVGVIIGFNAALIFYGIIRPMERALRRRQEAELAAAINDFLKSLDLPPKTVFLDRWRFSRDDTKAESEQVFARSIALAKHLALRFGQTENPAVQEHLRLLGAKAVLSVVIGYIEVAFALKCVEDYPDAIMVAAAECMGTRLPGDAAKRLHELLLGLRIL